MKPWKIQKFFEDVVYDLRSRGLLPVVIALVVAMVAVPVLISRGGSDSSGSSLQAAAGAPQTPPETKEAVVSYTPAGIRNYKERLGGLSPQDPFRQQFAQSAATASQLNSTVTTAAGATSPGSDPSSSGASASGDSITSGGTGGGSGTKTRQHAKKNGKKNKKKSSKTTYSYSVTVMAGEADATLTPFKDVASLTPLPSQSSPVVLYWGLSTDFSRALFLVSNKVDTLDGPGTCIPAPDDCSLLTLAPGESEDLHYAQDGKTYRLVVNEIKRVAI